MGQVLELMPEGGLCHDNEGVARRLRLMADKIERGDWGLVQTIVQVIEFIPIGQTMSSITRWTIATQPTEYVRTVGLLTWAAHNIMAD